MAKNLFDFGSEEVENSDYTTENSKNNSATNYNGSFQNNMNNNSQTKEENKTYQNGSTYSDSYNGKYTNSYNNTLNNNSYGNAFNRNTGGGNYNNIEDEAKNLYDKYKDYSQNDLISEFLSSSKQKLKDGSLTQEKINSTANALLPFLNDSQKEMMSRLLERLND